MKRNKDKLTRYIAVLSLTMYLLHAVSANLGGARESFVISAAQYQFLNLILQVSFGVVLAGSFWFWGHSEGRRSK